MESPPGLPCLPFLQPLTPTSTGPLFPQHPFYSLAEETIAPNYQAHQVKTPLSWFQDPSKSPPKGPNEEHWLGRSGLTEYRELKRGGSQDPHQSWGGEMDSVWVMWSLRSLWKGPEIDCINESGALESDLG